ncbi:MAG: hypothetical protein PHG79_05405 [Methanosarcina sp.]|nr:hypothetical protein [Methanosarcina sp.]MDD3872762.1 hypothetical protein [Methanosarcina sp.]
MIIPIYIKTVIREKYGHKMLAFIVSKFMYGIEILDGLKDISTCVKPAVK